MKSVQKFSKNKMQLLEEIYLVADNIGLVRESLKYEEDKSDRIPYWTCKNTGRHVRYLEDSRIFEVSELPKTFDRWSNSVEARFDLPCSLEKLEETLDQYLTV